VISHDHTIEPPRILAAQTAVEESGPPPSPPGDSAKFKEWLEFMEAEQKTAH